MRHFRNGDNGETLVIARKKATRDGANSAESIARSVQMFLFRGPTLICDLYYMPDY